MSRLSWWIVIRTPAGVSAWEIGDPDPDERAELVMRARALVGFPAGDEWAFEPAPAGGRRPYDIALSEVPHANVGATIRPMPELTAVPRGTVTAYQESCASLHRQARIRDVELLLAGLDDASVDELIARRRPSMAAPKAVR